jgi:hypothetical protein
MRQKPPTGTTRRTHAQTHAVSARRQSGPLDVWLRATLWQAYGAPSHEPMTATLADAIEALCADRTEESSQRKE